MRLFSITFLAAGLLLLTLAASAQSIGAIDVGGMVQGAVTVDDPAPSYFFETSGPATLLAQVRVSPNTLTPVLLAADSTNRVISTASASPGMTVLESQFTVSAGGRYFVQVQGLNNTQGIFSLTLIDMNAATLTPAVATPTAPPTATLSPSLPGQMLGLGQSIVSEVNATTPELRFLISGTSGGLAVHIDSPARRALGFPAFTLLDGGGVTLAMLTDGLRGGTLILPPAEGTNFTLIAAHSGGETQPFRVMLLDALTYLVLESEALTRLNAPPATVAPSVAETTVPASPPAPADVDLLLRWDGAALMMTNISGAPVDISNMSLSGNNRRVDSGYWARSNPALNLAALPANACVGLRPLAYPDAPPLPPACNDLAAWWSADIVYVWGGETFDVYMNGALVATCTVSTGQCGIDVTGG